MTFGISMRRETILLGIGYMIHPQWVRPDSGLFLSLKLTIVSSFTTGGIAQFDPQQFSDQIYPSLTMPLANNKLFIAGEATSSAHG